MYKINYQQILVHTNYNDQKWYLVMQKLGTSPSNEFTGICQGGIICPLPGGQILVCGAFALLVGGAITRPQCITERLLHDASLQNPPGS